MSTPKVVVSTLIFLLRDDEILLGMKKRGLGSNRWNGAGGKVEPGESIEQGLIRECQEEISVTPTLFHKVAENDFLMDSDTAEMWHMYVHVYIATKWQGTPTESEELAPRWFKLSDIPYETMWEDDRFWLPQVLDGKLLRTEFSFNVSEKLLTKSVTEVESL
jgi:8-oxo-dGTP diphosphatase